MTSSGDETQPLHWVKWFEGYHREQAAGPKVTPALARILDASVPLDRFAEIRSRIGRDAPLIEIQRDGLNWWW